MIAVGAAGAVLVTGLTAGVVRYERLVKSEHAALLRTEMANAELQAELARLRDRVGASNQNLMSTQSRLTAVTDEARNRQQQLAATEQTAASKADRAAQLSRTVEQLQRDLHLAEAQRVTLTARLSKADADFAEEHARQTQNSATLDQSQKKLQQLLSERDKAVGERDQLRARISELEHRLAAATHVPKPVAEAAVTPSAAPHASAAPTASVAATAPAPSVAATAPAPSVAAPAPAIAAAPAPVAAAALAVVAAPAPVAAAAPAVAATPAPAAAPAATIAAASAPVAAPAPAVAAAPASPPAAVAAATPVAVAAASVAPAALPQTEANRPEAQRVAAVMPVTRSGRTGLGELERVLGSAGVDVAHLFSQFGVSRGEGGPFIPVSHGRAAEANTLTPEKLAALRNMVKSLPVAAPLESYDVGSSFGVRGDPVNGRASYHTGVDFLAPYMSPVYATAAGTVTYSGYRDDYGKVVEIDHGYGLTSRYAHLHRQTVSVGQRIAAHTQIGFLGSTGRATGPHVHYEVLVNGEPQDPQKFLSLLRLVPVAAQR